MPHMKGVERRLIADIDGEIMGEPAFTTSNCHATGGRYAHYRIAGRQYRLEEVNKELVLLLWHSLLEPVLWLARVSYPPGVI